MRKYKKISYSLQKKLKITKKNAKNKRKKTMKNRKVKKGGTKEKCVLCDKNLNEKPFIPSGCYSKHGKYCAHKICSKCWWDDFAQENKSHQCPGCVKGIPLNKNINDNLNKNMVIDLTED
jgi:hypothetical protein